MIVTRASEPVAATSQGSRRTAKCYKRWTFTSVWDRWHTDELYMGQVLGPHRAFLICHSAPQSQREICELLHLRSLDENKQAAPPWQRPGYWEAKKELSNLHKSNRQEQVPCFSVGGSVQRTELLLHYKSAWNG